MKAIHNLPKIIYLIGLRYDRRFPETGLSVTCQSGALVAGELTENATFQEVSRIHVASR
jgi:hypothetical protein